MVAPTRSARVGLLRLSDAVPISGREHNTEPGTASRTAETKRPKLPSSGFTFRQRPRLADFNPQKPGGSRPSRQHQRLWVLIGLRGGPIRTNLGTGSWLSNYRKQSDLAKHQRNTLMLSMENDRRTIHPRLRASRGVSHVAVLKATKAGRIPLEPDGTIDPAKADAAWERSTDPGTARRRRRPGREAAARCRGRAGLRPRDT